MLRSRKVRRTYGRRLEEISFLFPGLCGVTVFFFLPFADVIRRSFVQTISGKFCGFANYQMVIQNSAFQLAVKNTVRFILTCLPLLLLISLILAIIVNALWTALEKKQKADVTLRTIKTAYLLPMAIPAASVVLLWKLMFDRQGFVNGVFKKESMPYAWVAGRGLDEHTGCLCSSGVQLYMEESWIYHGSMAGRTVICLTGNL